MKQNAVTIQWINSVTNKCTYAIHTDSITILIKTKQYVSCRAIDL